MAIRPQSEKPTPWRIVWYSPAYSPRFYIVALAPAKKRYFYNLPILLGFDKTRRHISASVTSQPKALSIKMLLHGSLTTTSRFYTENRTIVSWHVAICIVLVKWMRNFKKTRLESCFHVSTTKRNDILRICRFKLMKELSYTYRFTHYKTQQTVWSSTREQVL